MSDWTGDAAPDFDKKLADAYVGRYILVGITYEDADGNELRREQLHGEIESVDAKGVRIALKGSREGEFWNMPPAYEAIHPAKPGQCKLSTTGEVVVDPDFVATWSVRKPRTS